MNEQAETVLADMMQRTLDGVDAATEFSKAQIPDVVEQLLLWRMIESATSMLISILLIIAVLLFVRWVYKDLSKKQPVDSACTHRTIYKPTFFRDEDGDVESHVMLSAVPVVVGLAMMFEFMDTDWLQILIAPKLYLLEYAADLVK